MQSTLVDITQVLGTLDSFVSVAVMSYIQGANRDGFAATIAIYQSKTQHETVFTVDPEGVPIPKLWAWDTSNAVRAVYSPPVGFRWYIAETPACVIAETPECLVLGAES